MIASLLVVLLVLFLAYWWGTQGIFSAVLHLLGVVFAGAWAFALWEVLALLLIENVTKSGPFAWGITLILPFTIFLVIFRIATDRLIKSNMHFSDAANMIGGGVAGLLTGILSTGILLTGLSFMHLGSSFLGYRPLAVSEGGEVIQNESGQMWIPVDRWAVGFFEGLSMGAFRNKTPMAIYQPRLHDQAGLYGLTPFEWASRYVVPGTVSVPDWYVVETPLVGFDPAFTEAVVKTGSVEEMLRTPGNRLVVLSSNWSASPRGTYDKDILRVPPSQIRLAVSEKDGTAQHLIPPLAASMTGLDTGTDRNLMVFDRSQLAMAGMNQHDNISWVFLVPEKYDLPTFVMIRHVRVQLPDKYSDEHDLASKAITGRTDAMGPRKVEDDTPQTATANPDTTDPGTPGLGYREGGRAGSRATEVSISNRLPRAFSKNKSGAKFALTGEARNIIVSGSGKVEFAGGVSKDNRIDEVETPSHMACVTVKLTKENAQSAFGGARVAAARLQGIWLEDSAGNKPTPVGYAVLYKGKMYIKVDSENRIRSASELRISDMTERDTLYLYFWVRKGVKINSYNLGKTQQKIIPPLEIPL